MTHQRQTQIFCEVDAYTVTFHGSASAAAPLYCRNGSDSPVHNRRACIQRICPWEHRGIQKLLEQLGCGALQVALEVLNMLDKAQDAGKGLGSIRSFVETWLRVSLFSMCSASTCIIACCSDGVGGRSFSGPCATVSRELGSRTCHLVLWVRYAIIHSMQSTIHAPQAPWTPTWGSSLLTRPLVWPKLQSQTAPCVTMLCISHLLI